MGAAKYAVKLSVDERAELRKIVDKHTARQDIVPLIAET
jgi:hypothetical protein